MSWLLVALSALWMLEGASAAPLAVPAGDWSRDVPLIEADEPEGFMPRVAVDRQGRVHVFWRSAIEATKGNVIMYRRLEGESWTKASDVLVTLELGPFIIGWAEIDDQDYINLLWFDQGRTRALFFSRAHTSLAHKATNWKTKTLDVPQVGLTLPHLVTAPGGKIHVIYPLDHQSVVYLSSENYGEKWSAPSIIWSVTFPEDEAISDPRIAVDAKGYLHAVWTRKERERSWGGASVFYARSTDNGQSWASREVQRSAPTERTTAWINVAVRKGNEIHLAWNRGAGSELGRFHSWSADNGRTWTAPKTFLPDFVSGQTNWPLMAVDSAGVLHVVSVAQGGREAGTSTGGVQGTGTPKYTFWDGAKWSAMHEFPQGSGDYDTALAVGLGNQLHLVHPAVRGGGRLLYTRLTTNAPPLAPQTITAPPEPTRAAARAVATPTTASARADSGGAGANTPGAQTLPRGADPLTLVVGPIIPVVVLLVCIVAIRLGRKQR